MSPLSQFIHNTLIPLTPSIFLSKANPCIHGFIKGYMVRGPAIALALSVPFDLLLTRQLSFFRTPLGPSLKSPKNARTYAIQPTDFVLCRTITRESTVTAIPSARSLITHRSESRTSYHASGDAWSYLSSTFAELVKLLRISSHIMTAVYDEHLATRLRWKLVQINGIWHVIWRIVL